VLIDELNPSAKIVTEDDRLRPDASEVFRLIGDNTLIKSLTDWAPKYDLRLGLQDTVQWFKNPENLARYKAWLYNI
jgi:nucleoside-diphosphate-sugar epimerase